MKTKICYVHGGPVNDEAFSFYTIVPRRTAKLLQSTAEVFCIFIGKANDNHHDDSLVTYLPYDGFLSSIPVLRNLGIIFFILKIARQHQIDIFMNVWNHYFIFPILFGAKMAGSKTIARVSGVPIKGNEHNSFLRKMKTKLGLLMERVSLQLADQCIFLSNSLLKIYLQRISHQCGAEIISQGCNTDRFKFSPSAKHKKNSPKRILYVGRITRRKGLSDALEALSRLTKDFDPNLEFVIAGFGPYKSKMVSLAQELDIERNVTFPGYVPNEALPSLYSSCDLLILPSHTEGLPNVVMEAMSCGLPVVATNVGGIPELLADSRGFLVQPKKPEMLAETIKHALSNLSLRANMIRKAREYIEKEHSYAAVRAKYLELFKKVST